jgi:phosphate transport system substrate-binding protein
MRRLAVPALSLAAALAILPACGGDDGASVGAGRVLRVSGSTTVNPVAADAAEALRKRGVRITIDDQGGSAGGIAQLGQGQVEIAMSSKPVSDDDKRAAPAVAFTSAQIGADAVGIVVQKQVYDGGVRSLSRDQLAAVFEGRVKNWKELGGPDVEVFVYDKEPGRGTREVLDKYLYKDGKPPPPPQSDRYAVVGGNEEGRAKVLSTAGAVTPLSTAFVVGYPKLAAVAVDGVAPTNDHIRDGTYALARPLFLLTNGPPTGAAKTFVNYVVSPAGQDLVRKHGNLTLSDLNGR